MASISMLLMLLMRLCLSVTRKRSASTRTTTAFTHSCEANVTADAQASTVATIHDFMIHFSIDRARSVPRSDPRHLAGAKDLDQKMGGRRLGARTALVKSSPGVSV